MIKQIFIRNFKNIESLDLDLVGGVYLITGENNLGKSHLIEAIVTVLTGDRSGELLMRGKESGEVTATIAIDGKEYSVKVLCGDKYPNGRLRITDIETGLTTENKSYLQQLCQHTDFDANQFIAWSDTAEGRRRQVETIKKLLPEKVRTEVETLTAEIAENQSKRTAANVELTGLRAVAARALQDAGGSVDESIVAAGPLDITAATEKLGKLVAKLAGAESLTAELEEGKRLLKEAPVGLDMKLMEFEGLIKTETELIRELETKLAEARDRKSRFELQVTELPAEHRKLVNGIKEKLSGLNLQLAALAADEKEADRLRLEIKDAGERNSLYEKVTRAIALQKQVSEAAENYRKQSEQQEERRAKRTKLIQDGAALPVDGLTFDEDGLYLNGYQFERTTVSTSDMTSVAVALQVASNKKTGVFKVMNGQDLGNEKMAAVIDFAKRHHLQGFIEEMRRGQDTMQVELIETTDEAN